MKKYLTSENENLNIYGVYIIKEYLSQENCEEKNLENLLNKINIKILSSLVDLLNKNNKKLSYTIFLILIDITSLDFKEELFIKEENILYKIITYLISIKNDKILSEKGIYFLRNISLDNINIQKILIKNNIFIYCKEIYYKYFFDNDFIHNIIKCLGNFTYDINIKYIKNYLILLDMIKPYLNNFTEKKRLNKYLNYIYNILINDDSDDIIIEYFFENEIYKNLIEIYPFNNDIVDINEEKNFIDNIKVLILKIFGKILAINDKNDLIKKLIDFGLINFLEKILSSYLNPNSDFNNNNNLSILKNLFLCISNLSMEIYYINIFYNKDIISKLIKIGNNIYNLLKNNFNINNNNKNIFNLFRETCYVLALIVINSEYQKLIPIIKYNNNIIIIFFIEGLDLFSKKNNIILLCLQALNKLVNYDKIMEEYNNNIRIDNNLLNYNFCETMERNGIKSILDIYILDKRKDINNMANNIYKKLYEN